MPLGREVSDFTAIARWSLHEAIAGDLRPWDPPILGNASPQQVFIGRLAKDSNLRQAARGARVNRPEAKDLLRRISCAGIDHQARTFARLTPGRLCHCAAWAFSAKQRHGLSRRRDRYDQDAVWTHVCIDDATRLIPLWLVGPSPTAAVTAIATEIEARWPGTAVTVSPGIGVATHGRLRPATQSPATHVFSEFFTLTPWIHAKPAGFGKKVHLHAQALAFFVLLHNFCWPGADGGATPAMLHGVAERPWTPRDVAALAFERQAMRPSA